MTPRIILLAPEDNCVVAATHLKQGIPLVLDGETIVLPSAVALGHKLTRYALRTGDKVIKYGAVIGHVTQDTVKGAHLHTHNMDSDYLPTYTLDTGKQFVAHPAEKEPS